ncbi:hypothetical protein CH330_01310 [candidate division WOR-3 bacterium JGI_Cruoil_03_51_56]|uniref:Uncharacterized protein n=1 Tax=candidate division WOR-3 bacterium JGI_Cruoil_03_51_56 TaxID=1973747 RepID=A0A235BXJ1_UNCW3|nr:MAG: hypothetical protein CH330_01310 [candidate division WOR-3 bacterium JGI_Cruoil_03_51_56]
MTGYRYRIADFMVDLLSINLDDQGYANAWQQALNDLKTASPNGEITHVQLRTFWKIPDISNQSTWNTPVLGAYEDSQQVMCDNYKKWVFGYPTDPNYGPCAAKRIHDAGFKLEFCLSTAWTGTGTIADSVPVFHSGPEADYPTFNGETFLTNYMDNTLRPTAEFLASNSNFENGDIFMLTFEMCYPYGDFCWNHNAKWISMIDEVRQIFTGAGKSSVLLTIDINGFYNDYGLGYDGLQLLIDNGLALDNQLPAYYKGLTGATYLSHLDFISISYWLAILTSAQIPATWTDNDVDTLIVPAFRNNLNWYKAGTGHGMVSGVFGRDIIQDFWAINQIMGKPILTNVGYRNAHEVLTRPIGSGGTIDAMAQKVAWVAQVRGFGSQPWCCGQDFERYCLDKDAHPTHIDTSWRNAPAQDGIIQEIRATISPAPTIPWIPLILFGGLTIILFIRGK